MIGNSSSPGAVLIVRLKKTSFLITFGLGRHLISDNKIERDYGLKVALNSIGRDALRAIDKASHERTPINSRAQASKSVDIFELALNTEVDLLTAITGTSKIEKFGAQVTGRDALSLNLPTGLSDLCDLLRETESFYGKNDYQQDFGWVDNFRRVREESKIQELDNRLVLELNQDSLPEICWLAEPEIIDWESSSYYILKKERKKTLYYPELRLHTLLEILKADEDPITLDKITTHQIILADDNFHPLKTWSAYNCLYSELNSSDETFILQNGNWYQVKSSFVQKVNESIQNIESYSQALPVYSHEGEGEYNEYVAGLPDYVLMDKKNISHGGGRSKIEYCDLIRNGIELIHVKRGTSSSNLSHLFSQGEVSAELLLSDSDFRQKLNDKLPEELKFSDVSQAPNSRSYTVVYAIVSEKEGTLSLPFFSKVRLKNAAFQLKLLGFKIAITKIDVSDTYKALSKVKSV